MKLGKPQTILFILTCTPYPLALIFSPVLILEPVQKISAH